MSNKRDNAYLKAYLLGGCDFNNPDGPLHLETAKTSALLAYLLMQPGPQQRHKLMGLFWGNLPEANARRNLRRALWDLRRKLERPDASPFILATQQTVAFNHQSSYWLDVDEYTAKVPVPNSRSPEIKTSRQAQKLDSGKLQDAIALYGGDFLDGFHIRGAPDFEEWMLAEREHLRTFATLVLHKLVQHHAARGEYATGIKYARQLLTLEPWREEGHRELMRLYALDGQRSAALAQYQECCRLLDEELGLEPLAETTNLYQRLLQWEDGYLGIFRQAGTEIDAHLPQFANLPFIGREEEQALLVDWWEAVRRCRGRLALVKGEAGVGKTRLIEEMARFANAQGTLVLRGGCYEFGGSVPYQPIAAALRKELPNLIAQASDQRNRNSNLSEVWLTELSQLLPELKSMVTNLPEPSSNQSETARQRLFEAIARFLQAALGSHSSVIVFIDDLHWADQSTLDLLHYLVRSTTETPIWFIGAYRPEEVSLSHPLARLQHGLGRDHLVDRLALEPLSGEAVDEISRTLVGEKHGTILGDMLYRESEGNAFILVEALYYLRAQGVLNDQHGNWAWDGEIPGEILPDSVQDIILQRVGRLGEAAQHLLTLAAVIGRQFDATLLHAATELDANKVDDILDEWFSHHLISPQIDSSDGSWDFAHDKIRAVVYQAAGQGRRRILHRQVGEALEHQFPDQIDEYAALLAHHWEIAEVTDKAVHYLLRAGDQARLVYAHEEAIDYYQRALALQKDAANENDEQMARTLMRMGLTHHNAFDFQQARQAYEEGFVLWKKAGRKTKDIKKAARQPLRTTWINPPTLDPTIADDLSSIGIINQLFSGLVELSAEMGVVPGIARNWEVIDGGRTFVFYLRNDVRWSDGVTVTAGDFACAWKRILNPDIESPVANLLYDIKGAADFHQRVTGVNDVGVHIRDEFTLLVELAQPSGYLPQLLAQSAYYPVPQHIVEAHDQAWTDIRNIVTNGPFRLESWRPDQSMVLSRNPEYHSPFTGNLERIELILQSLEPAVKLEMYEAGDLDFLDLPSLQVDRARQKHAGEFMSFPTLYTEYLGFDTSQPPFDDPRVRRAFALATDHESLADIAFRGYVSPATGGFVPPGIPGHSAGIGIPYDPEEARNLLTEAGYPNGHDFPKIDAVTRRAMLPHPDFLQSQWQENLGLEISWDFLEWAVYLERLEELAHVFLMGWIADYPDPDNFLRVGLWRERTRWGDETYDKLVGKARRITNQRGRMQLYRQAEKLLIEDAVIMPLYYGRQHLLVKPWVSRLLPTSASGRPRWKDVVIVEKQ